MVVSIVLPVFNEEERIERCLDSLIMQKLILQNPGSFEVLVVDSDSTDRTVQIALGYPVGIMQAPKGKLQARMVGIEHARGHIIVAVDGDCTYPPEWLGNLVRHFADPGVSATSGPRLYSDGGIINLGLLVNYFIAPKQSVMVGSNSAFRKHHYYQAGGFQSANELDARSLQQEEEYNFGERLARLGRYVYDREAVCYTSGRRWFDGRHASERQRGERF